MDYPIHNKDISLGIKVLCTYVNKKCCEKSPGSRLRGQRVKVKNAPISQKSWLQRTDGDYKK